MTATQIQFRRGSAAQMATFTGAQGEVVVDTTNNRVVVHDGATAGGFPARTVVQRSITGSGNLPIQAADDILNFNAASDLTPALPLSTTRYGKPVTINNKPGSHTQTVGVTGSDTIDGLTSVAVVAGQRLTFWPYNDGVNVGYFIN